MKKIITTVILIIVVGLIFSSLLFNFPINKMMIVTAGTILGIVVAYIVGASVGAYLLYLLAIRAIWPLLKSIFNLFKGIIVMFKIFRQRQHKEQKRPAFVPINNSGKKFNWRALGIISLVVIAIGIMGSGIYLEIYSENKKSDDKLTSTGGKECKMGPNKNGESKMGQTGQSKEKMGKIVNKPIAATEKKIESPADTSVVPVKAEDESNNGGNGNGNKKPGNNPGKQMVAVYDSLSPIIMEVEYQKWSKLVYIKDYYSDTLHPNVDFNVSYSGPVRAQAHDAFERGTAEADLDSPDFNKKIGYSPDNWCLNFTSMTPHTEKITIRRWVKRMVQV